MKTFTIIFMALVTTFNVSAQEVKHILYKGTVQNRAITLYLKQEPNPCGGETGLLYQAIYQYGSAKNWIELSISDNGKGNLCMTEFKFTGVMILKKKGAVMEGLWIGPDGKTQLKVILKQQSLSSKQQADLEEQLEKTHYNNHDC